MKLGSAATSTVIQRLTSPTGINASLGMLSAPDSLLARPMDPAQVRAQNAAADLAERLAVMKYPNISVYCEKIVNSLNEKFRTFSGNMTLAIEIRHSQDRLDGLQDALELYVDSVTQVLDGERGDWGDGMFYSGGYEINISAVKTGGKNFMQSAKVVFKVEVSRN